MGAIRPKEWVSLVRELAYDTEDCFDNFTRHLGNGERHDAGFNFKEYFRKMARHLKTLGARRGIANQIDHIKLRIKEVKALKTSYKLDDDTACSTSGHAALDPRLAACFAEEAHLVGVGGPRDDLARWVLEGENKHHRRVLSIVGCGGLGKTTLANAIYRRIQGHFHCHAFVSVSQKPDIKKIVSQVISQVHCTNEFNKDVENWNERESIAKLRQLLQDKRYLVIIDDIWSVLAWNAIKCVFPENNCSSRIITITRILEVASTCSHHDGQVYKMTPLSDIHSERLFFRRIFGSEDCCPKILNEPSYGILKKCGGLPLAIISIAGLLANKPRVKEEWEKVKRSIGSDLSKNQNLEGMKNILSLSYNDLSPNLKTCLLHLSNFLEDCVIEQERLVRRWIAEGFIPEERGRSPQEVAENYFYELINKSIIQPVDIGYDGKFHACRVHDMMLELILSKSNEENFITVVNGRQTVWENSQCFIRRLSIQHIDHELASVLEKKDLNHVRSLTVTSTSCIKYLPRLAKFKTLRVLDFEGCEGFDCFKEYDMNGMDNLFHLKYLSFRKTCISELPSGIVMLHDLETLDIRGTNIRELPDEIAELINLQHLLCKHSHRAVTTLKIPFGIGNMTNLREILGLNITMSSVGAVEELGNLINLNVLHVLFIDGFQPEEYERHAQMLLSSLCKLGSYQLQSVQIDYHYSSPLEILDSWSPAPSRLQSFEMIANDGLSKLPKWITSALSNLLDLSIHLEEVTEDDLHILGELPALVKLDLETSRVQNGRIPVKRRSFQCLNRFDFSVEEAVSETLLFEKWAMPKLERLSLRFCLLGVASAAEAYGFYFGIEHLPCLKVVEVNFFLSDFWSMDDNVESSICKAATTAIKMEANLHPNHPTLYGDYYDCGKHDEVDDDQSDNNDEVEDDLNEEHSDIHEYWDATSSPMLEGNDSY